MNARQIKKKDKAKKRHQLLTEIMDVTSACLQYHGKDGDRDVIRDVILKTKMALKGVRIIEHVTVYPVTSFDDFIKYAWEHESRYTAEELFKLV